MEAVTCNKLFPRKVIEAGREEVAEDPRRPELYRLWILNRILEWSPSQRFYRANPNFDYMFSCDELSFFPSLYF